MSAPRTPGLVLRPRTAPAPPGWGCWAWLSPPSGAPSGAVLNPSLPSAGEIWPALSSFPVPKQAARLGTAGSCGSVPHSSRAHSSRARALPPCTRWLGCGLATAGSPLSSLWRNGQLQYDPGPPASAFGWKLAWVCLLAWRKEGV